VFSREAGSLIRDMLELFSQASQIPLELYEVDNGVVREPPIRAAETLFPEYCRGVWALNGGQAKDICNQDMCSRAQEVARSGQTSLYACHAGLDNQADVLTMGDETVAVLQYGAVRLLDDATDSEAQRLKGYEEAMRSLGASSEEAEHLAALLDVAPRRTTSEWRVLNSTLFSLLKSIIIKYVVQAEDERRTEQRAYHDLQIRVQAAMAHAESLAEDLDDGTPVDVREKVEDIVGAITAASAVMHSLTRGEYLPKTYRWRSHSIDTFIEQALTLCRAEMRNKQLEARVDLQPFGGRIHIEASRRHLEQAINNLVQNAVKYSYRTRQVAQIPRYVSIRGRIVDDGYELVIGNYGVGIEPDEYETIFEAGYRGRLTTLEYRTGSGLGLPLTKQVIEKHGGRIRVESEPARGAPLKGPRPHRTRFIVWLPLSQKR